MSSVIGVTPFFALPNVVSEICHLIFRIRDGGELLSIARYRERTAEPIKKYPVTSFTRSEAVLTQLVADVLESDECIRVECAYTLCRLGKAARINIEVFGARLNHGITARESGAVQVSANYSDFLEYRPFVRLIESADAAFTPTTTVADQRSTPARHDLEDFFLTTCGLDRPNRGRWNFTHALLFVEGAAPTPDSAHAVYHADVRDFADDIKRIFAEYHWGTPTVWTFETPPDMPAWREVAASQKCVPGRTNIAAVEDWLRPSFKDWVKTLDACGEEEVASVSALSVNNLKALIHEVVMQSDVLTLHDCGERGLVLFAGAEDDVSSVYRHILKAVM